MSTACGLTTEYHKIQSLYKRDEKTKRLLHGKWTLDAFEYLSGNDWVFTEKVDGTNIRIVVDPTVQRVYIGGRTDRANLPANLLNVLHDLFVNGDRAKTLLSKFSKEAVLYGEGFGGGIQRGSGHAGPPDFILFDVRVDGWWLPRAGVESIASGLGVKAVPVIHTGPLSDAVLFCTRGFESKVAPGVQAEGVVARPAVELKTRAGERLIAKLKVRDYKETNPCPPSTPPA